MSGRGATAALLALACGCEAAAAAPAPSLATSAAVARAGAGEAAGALVFHVGGADGTASSRRAAVRGLDLQLVPEGGDATLARLSLPLDDVELADDAVPAAAVALSQLTLSLRAPARLEVAYADRDRLTASGVVRLELDWALRLPDGTSYAPGAAALAPLPLTVDVTRDGGGVTVTVDAAGAGPCARIEGLPPWREATLHAAAAAVE